MKKSLKTGEVIFTCSFCQSKYIVNTLTRGRVKQYCSNACKTKAYRSRSGQLGKKFKHYFLDGNQPKREKFKQLDEYEQSIPKVKEKRASFIKRRIDVQFRGYLALTKRYNKIFKVCQSENSRLNISDLGYCYSMLKDENAKSYVSQIKSELERLESTLGSS